MSGGANNPPTPKVSLITVGRLIIERYKGSDSEKAQLGSQIRALVVEKSDVKTDIQLKKKHKLACVGEYPIIKCPPSR